MAKVRAIALYLPQFHPIPENDEWWGSGFTEWTNTAKARALFPGHYQPHIPGALGFYDLRLSETRVAQADLARQYGIEGFCYYHYWFAGKKILERPFEEVVASGTPDFPFCICWANETWSGIWHGAPNKILLEQTYPGESDDRAHFEYLLPALRDSRYIRVNGLPLIMIYRPFKLKDAPRMLRLWREMAVMAGLGGIHFAASVTDDLNDARALGFDAIVRTPNFKQRRWVTGWRRPLDRVRQSIAHRRGIPHVYPFADLAAASMPVAEPGRVYPCIAHSWDNTPRSGREGVAYTDADPRHFRTLLQAAVGVLADKPAEERIVFLKSWNEWAEGNHLEPDRKYGLQYLETLRDVTAAA